MKRVLPEKRSACRALQSALERSLQTMINAARITREGAIHEENRAEGSKDMRSTEQSYLARGQAMRVEDLEEQLRRLVAASWPDFDADTPIAAGALARVEVDEVERVFFVLPYGGGNVLRVGGVELTVVTPSSPLGELLLGKKVGDDFELVQRGVTRSYVITDVD